MALTDEDPISGFVTLGEEEVRLGSDAPIEGSAISHLPEMFPGVSAVFRRNNPFVSAITREHESQRIDDSYPGPWEGVKGTKYEQHWESFTGIFNKDAEDARKRQIDRELEDKKIEDAMPWYQRIPAQILAGMIDPTIALPGVVWVKGVKGGISAIRTGVASGVMTGAGVAAQESVLHATQETRELSESAMNIGGSVILGGLIGTAAARLLTPAEFSAGARAIEEAIEATPGPRVPTGEISPTTWQGGTDLALGTAIPQTATKTLTVDGKIVAEMELLKLDDSIQVQKIQTVQEERRKGHALSLLNDLRQEFPDTPLTTSMQTKDGAALFKAFEDGSLSQQVEPTMGVGSPVSAGAAATGTADVEIAGTAASALAQSTRKLNPILRALTSESKVWREVATNLMENPLYLKGNFDGVRSAPAVETLMQEHNGGLTKALQDQHDAYKEYRKANGWFTKDTFLQAVGKAMRRGDQDADPTVARAAQSWRSNVFEPMKLRAIELKMLPEDVSVETAQSYFSRMYNHTRMVARESEFKDIVARWVHGEAPKWATKFDEETAVAAAKLEGPAKTDYLTERRIEREAQFDNLNEKAAGIADEVFDKITGRTADRSVRPEFITVKARGPLKERTFDIPDALIEDFLEHNVEKVGRRYVRIMGSDIELTNKFGSADMAEQIQKVKDDYNQLRAAATTEKEKTKLFEAEKKDIKDLESVRDLLRGVNIQGRMLGYDYTHLARMANMFNYVRVMGQVTLSSITDAVRPAMVHGVDQYMQTMGQLATNLQAVKLSVREAQLAGNISERWIGARLGTLSDMLDPYAARGPVETLLERMTDTASHWNGIRIWTDGMKSIAAVMTQNRLLRNADKFTSLSKKELAYMNYLGIDESMAGRIAGQMAKHGEDMDGVRVANTADWDDAVARRTFRAAINKDVDSIVVERSVGDIPLLANEPIGRVLLQFKSFALASHQRVLLRGLQEGQARFVSGIIGMTTLGMMMTYFRTWTDNRPEERTKIFNNPGWWIGEGLDRSGIFSVPFELANTYEKATGDNPLKAPIRMFDEKSAMSQKLQTRNQFGQALGPTAGLGQELWDALKIPGQLRRGEDVTRGQKTALSRLFPYNSYLGVRQMINYVINPPPGE